MKSMLFILGAFLLGHVLYIIPLPPTVWGNLPGREFILNGYQTLGTDLPWLSLSLSPEKSLFSLFDFLAPLAVILMMGTIVQVKEVDFVIRAIGAAAILFVIIGLLQVSNVNDSFYPYEITNKGSAVGFFSNANHFGVFLLMSIPVVASLFSRMSQGSYSYQVIIFGIVVFVAAFLGIGLSLIHI